MSETNRLEEVLAKARAKKAAADDSAAVATSTLERPAQEQTTPSEASTAPKKTTDGILMGVPYIYHPKDPMKPVNLSFYKNGSRIDIKPYVEITDLNLIRDCLERNIPLEPRSEDMKLQCCPQCFHRYIKRD